MSRPSLAPALQRLLYWAIPVLVLQWCAECSAVVLFCLLPRPPLPPVSIPTYICSILYLVSSAHPPTDPCRYVWSPQVTTHASAARGVHGPVYLWVFSSRAPRRRLKVPARPNANLFQSFFISCILLQLEVVSPLLPFTSLRPPPSDSFLLSLSRLVSLL